jgi:hypothetical protein
MDDQRVRCGYHAEHNSDVMHNVVGNGYFAAIQIPLLAGRTFGPQDTPTSRKVAVISERMARTLFPEGSPIGRHYGFRDPKNANDFEAIGIVKDVKSRSLLQPEDDVLDYLLAEQRDGYMNDFDVRYTGTSALLPLQSSGPSTTSIAIFPSPMSPPWMSRWPALTPTSALSRSSRPARR